MKNVITVKADFDFLPGEQTIGHLEVDTIAGRGDRFMFTFDKDWISAHPDIVLDPSFSSSSAYFSSSMNIPFLSDLMPDRWGRILISRHEARLAEKEGIKPRACSDLDYLLKSDDMTRKGGIRLQREDGTYFSSEGVSIPPVSKLGDYIDMVADYEKNGTGCTWLEDFFSSSSSLGGARPKINVIDTEGNLWIAKVPSLNDQYDIGAWEKVAMDLARKAGIETPQTMLIAHGNGYHTFLSKRFDRKNGKRIHMASALCLLNFKNSNDASFLDIAEIISQYSKQPETDLKELYRRLVFSAIINSTDNHLRNHSFLLTPDGWILSPAYDLNPSIHGRESVLAVDEGIHRFSMAAIKETALFYNLEQADAMEIIDEVREAVSQWEGIARSFGLAKEILLMRSAFGLS